MFIACAAFMAILKPANAWTLLAINVFTYVTVTAASVFDVVVVVVGATDEDDNTLGYPLNLLTIRLSLGMITSCVKSFYFRIFCLFVVGLNGVGPCLA
jgi:type III secretory pathway component EscS